MTRIRLETRIAASPERCFDLSRDVDLHMGSMAHTTERAIAGVTRGEMDLGDSVTWEAMHLGRRWRMTVQITALERPSRFVDEQARGPFASLRHGHEFKPTVGGTLMIDDFQYTIPLGPLGRLVDRVYLRRYMRRLLEQRNRYLRETAESAP